jgi:tetratricopeptide (TPR) repeat protein
MACRDSKGSGDASEEGGGENAAISSSTGPSTPRGDTYEAVLISAKQSTLPNPQSKHTSLELAAILDAVQPSVKEFFSKLNAFNKNKQETEELRMKLLPPGVLESVEVAAVGLWNDQGGNEIKLELYQRQLDGKTPIQNTDELYATAEAVLPLFTRMLNQVAAKAGVAVKLPGLKGRDRAEPKAAHDYSNRACPNDGPPVGWVFDIVRGTLLCDSVASIKAVVALLVNHKSVKVIKFKNRFKHPTPNGFCDMLFQILFNKDGLVHVCEVQVHLRQITEYADEHQSHASYDYFRQFFDGSMTTVAARLQDMETIVGAHFVPSDGLPAAAVLEGIVVDVIASEDIERIDSIASLCRDYLSEFELAMYFFENVLAIKVKALGPNHQDVGSTYNNMAIVLRNQGKNAEAMVYYKKALAIRINALGPNHHDVGATFNNMAVVLRSQGKNTEAMAYYDKALAIKIKTLGPDNQSVGTTYNNMAIVFQNLGKNAEAMVYYEKALEITIKALGPNHQDVGATYNNMAMVLRSQGKDAGAIAYYKEALTIRIKALGPNHQDVGSTYNNLASVLQNQGKNTEAMAYYEKAVAIAIKALGPNHQDVGATYNNMAGVLKNQGKITLAMAYYDKALAIQIEALGPNHQSVGDTCYNMAVVEGKEGNLKRALELFTRASDTYALAHGSEHSETLDAIKQVSQVRAMMA